MGTALPLNPAEASLSSPTHHRQVPRYLRQFLGKSKCGTYAVGLPKLECIDELYCIPENYKREQPSNQFLAALSQGYVHSKE